MAKGMTRKVARRTKRTAKLPAARSTMTDAQKKEFVERLKRLVREAERYRRTPPRYSDE